MPKEKAKIIVCSFCHLGVGEGDDPVKKLMTGEDRDGKVVAICDKCIEAAWGFGVNAGPIIPIPKRH